MQGTAKKIIYVCLVFLAVSFGACQKISNDGTGHIKRLEIFSISPTKVLSHLPFLLKVTGQGFDKNSMIVFYGSEVPTDNVAPGELIAEIPADMVSFPLDQPDLNVAVWVVAKDPSTGNTLTESSHLYLLVRSMPEFSEPRSIYQIRAEYDNIYNCKLLIDTNDIFYLVWKEVAWWLDGSEVTKLGISTDGGQTWNTAREIPPHESFFAREGKLFAFPGEDNVTLDAQLKYYYSSDGGSSWETGIVGSLDQEKEFGGYKVCMDANGKFTLVYGQVGADGFVRLTTLVSPDSGGTWEVKGESVTPADMGIDWLYGFHLHWLTANTAGGVTLGCTYDSIIPNAESRVYMSTDGGAGFLEFTGGLSERNILYFYGGYLSEQGTLYTVYCDNEYYRVYNTAFFRGENFGSQTAKLQVFSSAPGRGSMVINKDEQLYILSGAFIMRSVDKGDGWTEPTDLSAYIDGLWVDYHSMAMDGSQKLYIIGENGRDILMVQSGQPENEE